MTAAGGPLVGVDVASIRRLATAIRRHPGLLGRLFTDLEQQQCAGRPASLAARFAAKEAVRKIAGSRGEYPLPGWREIEVDRNRAGAPRLRIRGAHGAIGLSLTHDADLAIAVAVALADPDTGVSPPSTLVLPERPDDANKGTFGTVVVLAGSHGLSGAAYLAAMGAARAGAGIVRLCVPQTLHLAMSIKCVEVMPHALDDGGRGTIGPGALARLRDEHIAVADSVVIGPGLGRAHETGDAVADLLGGLSRPTVLDADGLTLLADRDVDWRALGAPIVLTPHPGEMARLAHVDVAKVQTDRERAARAWVESTGTVLVLKGAGTIVAAPDGRVHVDEHRLVALATGGTGDVLSGICGAMLAAGLPAFDAAVAAVTIHAEAGREIQAARGRAGALASDLLEALPAAQERLRRGLEARLA